MLRRKNSLCIAQGFSKRREIAKIFELRNKVNENDEYNSNLPEYPFFCALPSFTKADIDYLSVERNDDKTIKDDLLFLKYDFKYSSALLQTLQSLTKTIYNPSDLFVLVTYYQAITLCFITPNELDSEGLRMLIECLTKCGFTAHFEFGNLIFRELMKITFTELNLELDSECVDAIINHIGLTDSLPTNIYQYFVAFMKYVINNPHFDRNEQVILLLNRLIYEKRKFLQVPDLAQLEEIVFPYVYIFDSNALSIISQLTIFNLDGYTLEIFTTLAGKIVNYIKQNETPLIPDTDKQLSSNSQLISSQQHLHYKTPISQSELYDIIKNSIQTETISPQMKEICTRISTNLQKSAQKCLHLFFISLSQELESHENEKFYYTIMSVFITIFMDLQAEPTVNDVQNTHLSKIFKIRQSIFEPENLCPIISSLKTDVLIFYSKFPSNFIIELLKELQSDPMVIGELAARMYANKILVYEPLLLTILIESANKLKFFDTKLSILCQYGILCYISYIVNTKPELLFDNRIFTYSYFQYLSCETFTDFIISNIRSCFMKSEFSFNLQYLSDFINDHSMSADNVDAIGILLKLIGEIVYYNPKISYIMKESTDFILNFASLSKDIDTFNAIIKIFIIYCYHNTSYNLPLNCVERMTYVFQKADTKFLTSQISNILSRSPSNEPNEVCLLLNPSFVLPLLMTESISSKVLEKLIKLCQMSRNNIHRLHIYKIDTILLNSLLGEFNYDCVKINLSLDPKRVLNLVEQISIEISNEPIIKNWIMLIKHRPEINAGKYFNKALNLSMNMPSKKYPLKISNKLSTISGINSTIFDLEYSFMIKFKVDNSYLHNTHSTLRLFYVTDENNSFEIAFDGICLYAKTMIGHEPHHVLISSNNSWNEEVTMIMTVNFDGEKSKIATVKNDTKLPVCEIDYPIFRDKATVTIGGGTTENTKEDDYGYFLDFAIANKQLTSENLTDGVFVTIKGVVEGFLYPDGTDLSEVKFEISDSKYHLNIFDIFKRTNLITKYMRAAIYSNDYLEQNLINALSAMKICDIHLNCYKRFYGIGKFINSKLYYNKCGTLRLFKVIVNTIPFIPQPCQVELLDNVLFSLYSWIYVPYDDLIEIIDCWSGQLMYSYIDIFENLSIISRIVADMFTNVTDPKVEIFTVEQMNTIVEKLTEFLKDLASLKITESDIQLLAACASNSSQPYTYLSIIESISSQLINLNNTNEVKQGLQLLISHADPVVVSSSLFILNFFQFSNHAIETLSQLLRMNPNVAESVADSLLPRLKDNPRMFLLICALVLECDQSVLIKTAQAIQSTTSSIINESIYSGMWFIFPILFAIQLPADLSENIFTIISTVALKTRVDIKNSLGFLELCNSRVRMPHRVDYVAIYLKCMINNCGNNQLVFDTLFGRLASHIVYRVDGPSHHDELINSIMDSPFAQEAKDIFKDTSIEIKHVRDIENLICQPPRISFWYDKVNTLCEDLVKINVNKASSGKELMEIIDHLKVGEELEENEFVATNYAAYFEDAMTENNTTLKESLTNAKENTKPHKIHMSNLQSRLKERTNYFLPSPINNDLVHDRTRLGVFCPSRMKIHRGYHKYPGALNARGIQCKLIELDKITDFSIIKRNNSIIMTNDKSSKMFGLDLIVNVVNRKPMMNRYSFEIFTKPRVTFLVSFSTNENIVDIPSTEIDIEARVNKTVAQWQKHTITNFELLMKLNFLSGRSFADPALYPFIPYPSDVTISSDFNTPPAPFPPHKTKIENHDIHSQKFLAADYFFSIDAYSNSMTPIIDMFGFRERLESDRITDLLPGFIDKVWGKDVKFDFQHQILFDEKFPSRDVIDFAQFERQEKLCSGIITYCAQLNSTSYAFYNKTLRKLTVANYAGGGSYTYDCHQDSVFVAHRDNLHAFYKNTHNCYRSEMCELPNVDDFNLVCSTGSHLIYAREEFIVENSAILYSAKASIVCMCASSPFDILVFSDNLGETHFLSLHSFRSLNKKFKFKASKILISEGLGFIFLSNMNITHIFDSSCRHISAITKSFSHMFSLCIRSVEVIIFTGSDFATVICLDRPDIEHSVRELIDSVFIKFDPSMDSIISVSRHGDFRITNISKFKFIQSRFSSIQFK